jgi:hypothetical protein
VIFREALDGLTAAETKETLKIVNKITARFRAAISRQLDEGEGSNE